jgi:hypothetical protein
MSGQAVIDWFVALPWPEVRKEEERIDWKGELLNGKPDSHRSHNR